MLFVALLASRCASTTAVFEQAVDHFGGSSGTFSQRYVLEGSDLSADAPIIVQVAGLSSLDAAFFPTVRELAQRAGAKLLRVENRYFGASIPRGDASLRHLRSSQIAEDIVAVVRAVAPQSRHRVAVGGRYGGAIALRLRAEYPQHFGSAWVSLAPVRAQTLHREYDYARVMALYRRDRRCFGRVYDAMVLVNRTVTGGDASARAECLSHFGLSASADDASALYVIAEGFGVLWDADRETGAVAEMCREEHLTAEVYGRYFRAALEHYGVRADDLNPMGLSGELSGAQRNVKAAWKLMCDDFGGFHVPPVHGTMKSIFFRSPLVNQTFYENVCRFLFGKEALGDFEKSNFNEELQNGDFDKVLFTVNPDDAYGPLMVEKRGENSRNVVSLRGGSYLQDLIPLENESQYIRNEREKWMRYFENLLSPKQCVNGEVLDGRCVCFEDFSGEYCNVKTKSVKALKNMATCLTVIPTLIIILASFVFWKTIFVHETKNVTSSLFQ